MFISSLSQEQLHRQSPLSVLSTHGVKPHGGLDLAQPATTMGRIHQIFTPAVHLGSLGIYSGIQMGSNEVRSNG